MEATYSLPLCTKFFISFFVLCLALFSAFVTCSHKEEERGRRILHFFSVLLLYSIILLLLFYSSFLPSLLRKSALNRCKRQLLQRGGSGASSECLGADSALGCGLLPHGPSSRRANSASIISCIVPRRSMRSSWILRFSSRRSPERFVLFVFIWSPYSLFLKIGRLIFLLH